MPLVVEVPAHGRLDLRTLVVDVNGTLTNRGRVLPGVAGRMNRVTPLVRVLLASADTFGTVAAPPPTSSCLSIADALDLLLDERALVATLRR